MQLRDEIKKLSTLTNEILQQVRQLNRLERHRDFSFIKLLATVIQIMVLGIIFWVAVGVLDLGNDIGSLYKENMKLLLAILLQLIALTLFIIDKKI